MTTRRTSSLCLWTSRCPCTGCGVPELKLHQVSPDADRCPHQWVGAITSPRAWSSSRLRLRVHRPGPAGRATRLEARTPRTSSKESFRAVDLAMRITSKTLENTLYLAYNSNRETPARPPRRASPSASEAPPAKNNPPRSRDPDPAQTARMSRYLQPAADDPWRDSAATGGWCSHRPPYILTAAK